MSLLLQFTNLLNYSVMEFKEQAEENDSINDLVKPEQAKPGAQKPGLKVGLTLYKTTSWKYLGFIFLKARGLLGKPNHARSSPSFSLVINGRLK